MSIFLVLCHAINQSWDWKTLTFNCTGSICLYSDIQSYACKFSYVSKCEKQYLTYLPRYPGKDILPYRVTQTINSFSVNSSPTKDNYFRGNLFEKSCSSCIVAGFNFHHLSSFARFCARDSLTVCSSRRHRRRS